MADVWTDRSVAHAYRTGHLKYPDFLAQDVLDYYREFMSQKERIPLSMDVACGSGQFSFPLVSVSDRVIGLDISEAQIAEARVEAEELKLSTEKIQFLVGSAYDLSSLDIHPDVLTLFTTLHHLDPKRFIQEACAVLRPGGALALFMMKDLGFVGDPDDTAFNFYKDFLNKIWSKSDKNNDRSAQEALYREVYIPLDDVKRVDRFAEIKTTKEKFGTYLSTYSGFVRYRSLNQEQADSEMKQFLTDFFAYFDGDELVVKKQYIVVLGRKVIF